MLEPADKAVHLPDQVDSGAFAADVGPARDRDATPCRDE
uniref:Uncharacterized protein n=1 Tax=Ralstonia solanacearum TaxID=305 RepID=A0A0S4W9J5_RALSL|nr:protein of unknown function [Ralstonia solanacearum]